MHLWDAARSQGTDLAIDPALVSDGLDEIVAVLFPQQVHLSRTSAVTRPVALRPTDADLSGFVVGGDGRVTVPCCDAVATVRGPASALMLLLWKRIPSDDEQLVVSGDRAAYLDLVSRALTP